jgi:hypothetical protein
MRLDYTRMRQDQLDGEHGLRPEVIDRLTRRFSEVQAEVATRRESGEYGFYALANQAETVAEI